MADDQQTKPSVDDTGASPTTRRHGRPAVVTAAVVLLTIYGALSVLGGLQERFDLLPTLTGGLLLLTAAGLLWGGRAGYWLGLAVTTLVALLALMRRPEADTAALTAAAAVPLGLLAAPAARRVPPAPVAAPAAPATDPQAQQQQAWSYPRGWGGLVAALLLGLLFLTLGLGMAWSEQGSRRGLGASLVLFGLGFVALGPTAAPKRRQAHLTVEALRVGNRQDRGVAFPYSRTTIAASLVGLFLVGLGMLSIAVLAGAPLPIRLAGFLGVPLLGQLVLLVARRGAGRRWRIVVTPSAVVYAPGEVATVVPWAAIVEVTRGAIAQRQVLRLFVNDRRAIQRSTLTRILTAGGRLDPVVLPVGGLGVAPALLYRTLRHYLRHPAARHELAAGLGLERVRQGDFDDAGSTPQGASP